jgi:hypothetical protein
MNAIFEKQQTLGPRDDPSMLRDLSSHIYHYICGHALVLK